MIKIILPVFVIPLLVFAQQNNSVSFQNLKHEIESVNYPGSGPQLKFNPDNQKKSVGLAVIYSLLLPGMGELYADAYDIGKYFTIADGVLWGTFAGMNVYANWQENNYKNFAEIRAGVSNINKDENYYAVISQYSSIDSYNDEKALERDFGAMYDPAEYFWKWNSTEERREYREMWTSAEQTSNDTRFIIGGLILNRIASAINAARLVSSYNNRLEEGLSWNFSVGFTNPQNLPTSISFNFQSFF